MWTIIKTLLFLFRKENFSSLISMYQWHWQSQWGNNTMAAAEDYQQYSHLNERKRGGE